MKEVEGERADQYFMTSSSENISSRASRRWSRGVVMMGAMGFWSAMVVRRGNGREILRMVSRVK